MNIIFLLTLVILSFGIFFVPKRHKFCLSFFLHLGVIVLTSTWAIQALNGIEKLSFDNFLPHFWTSNAHLKIDKLSAFFILIVNFTCLTGILYAKGYLKPYFEKKTAMAFSIHFFSFLWLHLSMLLVTMMSNGLTFMIAWEIMSVTSFLLVMFDAEDKTVLRTGINYLIQMHIGLMFIMLGFLTVEKYSGYFSFEGIKIYAETHSNFLLFLIFFVGFGIKAGFIPLHTWLPQAHPAAPSHVSGVMSGVMIKIGIYGILRIIASLKTDFFEIGSFLLTISIISGLLGVMFAIVQHDLKKLLAYHSIENIGIIGIGIGAGLIGISIDNSALAVLGLTGGILHILNHSLFKSLLFYSAGSVYSECHTKNVEQLGGLAKKMPKTAIFFLLGSLAICGLPPFNGFISEFLIYSGFFKGMYNAALYRSVAFLLSIVALALIGGLAIFCFTKAFGIVFLGEARSEKTQNAKEVSAIMLFSKFLISIFIIGIGILPMFFVQPISKWISEIFSLGIDEALIHRKFDFLPSLSIFAGIFILTAAIILLIRYLKLKKVNVRRNVPWGCGYTALTPTHQYTSTSFADHYATLANPILRMKKHFKPIEEEEIFPKNRHFEAHSEDIFQTKIEKIAEKSTYYLQKLAFLQTGQLQHYILYAFLFILLVFGLTFFKIL